MEWDSKMAKKASKGVNNEIYKVVQPFMNWLKEAEEESDNSDDNGNGSSDSELEVSFFSNSC